MDDPVFKQKYKKYKLRVKLWEKDFKKKNGRVPSKYDIRDASQEIRDSYKMYYKLKTSFLEDTLNDVLSDDGFDILEMSQLSQRDGDLDVSLNESTNGGPDLPLDICELMRADDQHDKSTGFSNVHELPEGSLALASANGSSVLKNFEPVEELDLNKKAWSEKVSKKTIVKETKETTRSIMPNFKEKLFTNSSFSKRNPRKSLSRSTLDSSLGNTQSTLNVSLGTAREVLPDLETILLQKAKEQQTTTATNANHTLPVEKSKETIKTQVDERWLDRNAAQNGITKPSKKYATSFDSYQNKATPGRTIAYGLSNIDVTKILRTDGEESKVNDINILQTAGTETQQNCTSLAASEAPTPMDMPLKTSERCANKDSDSDSEVGDSEEENESQEYRHIAKRRRVIPSTSPKTGGNNHTLINTHNEPTNTRSRRKGKIEDIKCEQSEYVKHKEAPNTKRSKIVAKRKTASKPKDKLKPKAAPKIRATKKNISNTPTKEEFTEEPLNPEDLKYALALERGDVTSVPRIGLTELDKADHLAQEYINTFTPIGVAGPSTTTFLTPAAEKRAAEKRKLEAKIAAGKLNENFVTIDIQKKTFVRGKKSINYSKYKKKQWKNTKRVAALIGPNMNMGGCDGGTLKCFTCGQAGHFAQNCKLKGDSLLPLTAQLEEDPSPFPTLEEAEQMASQSALAVHSRNITKLPQAANAAIYQTNSFTDDEDQVKNVVDGSVENIRSSNEDSDDNTSSDGDNKGPSEILMETDDELEDFDIDAATTKPKTAVSPIKNFVGHKIPESFLKAAGLDKNEMPSNSASSKFGGVSPLFDLNSDGSVKEATSEVLEVLKMFGHTNFRKGQDRAIMRILSGMSTLVTLSTGSGKSLCYQLPAYMYSRQCKAITLVISPLVSLMEDQVTGVPHFLRAHCLHTNQTPQQRVKIMQMISEGEIDVLLVSPEAVVSGERSTGFGSILRQLPPIAFACIDEAHCVSQWSHNFRPSYLMICKVLRKNLGVKCVLGLTATATLPTRLSIINHLGITDGEKGIISDIPLPDNLILSVSKDENKDSALLQLMLSKRFESCQSIIIYCTRRDECERVAGFLRTCLQERKAIEPENVKKKRKRVNWHAEPYHAGMNASRRRTIQNAFMNNELRIVVATIAFGMGINKPDIRAVIHYNMPSNFESYVQEVGRAGRDNKVSHCHLFLDANGGDKSELKRHIYANSLDRHVIRKLLQRIFVSCSCDKNIKDGVQIKPTVTPVVTDVGKIQGEMVGETKTFARHHLCPGHEIGFSIEKSVEALDIPAENISTLLCYMELDSRWNMNVLSNAYISAKVISYGGPKYLKHAAKECPPLAMAIAMEIKNGTFKETENIIEFSVIDIAAAIGWNSGVVKYQLKNLEWVQINGYPKRSPITVSFHDLGFRIKAPGDFTTEEIDDSLDTLYNRSREQEKKQLIQLQYVFQGLSSVAYNSHVPCCSETFSHDRSDQLKAIIRDYFRNDYPKDLKLEIELSNVSDSDLESDVITLINMYPENNFTGRNVARIFHGISSPNYPALMWYRCKFWRAHCKTDFNRIVQLANSVIVKRRT